MANYKETTGTATGWRRAKQVVINNPYQDQKNILFFEEDIAILDEKVFKSESGMLKATYDPTKLIGLRNPDTGELTGSTISQGLVYQALYSLYISLAEARDQVVASEDFQSVSPIPTDISV